MHFTTILISALASFALAQGSGTCYDDGDCILSGGGHCVKTATGLAGIVGTCSPKTATATATATGGSTLTTSVKPTGSASAGQGTCFDDGDCLLYQNTICQKQSGMITGTCVSKK